MSETYPRILSKAIWRLTVAVIVMYLMVIGLGTVAWVGASNQRRDIERVTSQTHNALCSLRGDLERRVAQGEKFLARHPNGIDGITPSVIQQSLANERQTISALASLSCSQEAT